MQMKTRSLRKLLLAAALAGLLAVPVTALAAAPRPGVYRGHTAQDRSVSLRVDSSARRISAFRIRWLGRCDGGDRVSARFVYRQLRVRHSRFSDSGLSVTRQRDRVVTHRVSVSGRWTSSRRVIGRWRARITVEREAGPTTNCTIRGLRWSARR